MCIWYMSQEGLVKDIEVQLRSIENITRQAAQSGDLTGLRI